MDIALTFTLTSGAEFGTITGDFDSLEACQADLAEYVGQREGALTWHLDGAKHVMAARHIVAVKLEAAGGAE